MFISGLSFSQDTDYKIATLAFYNLENLFDTVNDTLINDEEFLPDGGSVWTEAKFQDKIGNIAHVISQLGTDTNPNGPAIIGVSEVENRYVLKQLVKHKLIADKNYQIVHYDSPDRRGIDVALLYQKDQFVELSSKPLTLELYEEDGERKYTRDILLVSGELDGELIHVMVNHWPSRRGGEKKSAPGRNKGAQICRSVVDSLYNVDPASKVFIMGDLNDDPVSESVRSYLRAKRKVKDVHDKDIFNPMAEMYRRGLGSNAYNDAWSLFDQILFTAPVLDKEQEGYFYYKANIFNKKFLVQKSGRYKGYPYRTFSGGNYIGGYSDHFPVYVHLLKRL